MRGTGVQAGARSLAVLAACCVAGLVGSPTGASGEALSSSSGSGSSSSPVGGTLVVPEVQSLDEGQQAGDAEEAKLSNPEAVAEREASRTRFEGLGPEQARAEAAAAFPTTVEHPAGGPPPLSAGEKIVGFDEPNVARVDLGGGQVGVVESTVPMATQIASGAYAPVDLSLHGVGIGGFEPANPLVSVLIPKHLEEGVQLPGLGLSLTPVDSQGAPLGGAEGAGEGATVDFANTQTDTDTIVKPSSFGVSLDALIRSVESPEVLYYRVGMPQGARLVSSSGGLGAEVLDEGVAIASIEAPTATDAAGTMVPVSMSVSGSTLVVTVHVAGSYRYPILVDPQVVTVTESMTPSNWVFGQSGGYTSYSNGGIGMEHTGSIPKSDSANWSTSAPGNTKLYEIQTGVYLNPIEPGTTDYTYPFMSAWLAFAYGESERREMVVSGKPDIEHAGLCANAECAPGAVKGGNLLTFGITSTESWEEMEVNEGRSGSQPSFTGFMFGPTTYFAQEKGEHATVSYNTGSAELSGGLPNALYSAGGTWFGPRSGALEIKSHDAGLGVWRMTLEGHGAKEWETLRNNEYSKEGGCTGVRCAAEQHQILSWANLGGHLPNGEDKIRLRADDPMPEGWSSEYGEEGEATLKVDATPPHSITVSGLPAKGTEGKELTLGEGPAHLVVEASEGEGTTPSSGMKEIRLGIDGTEIGHGGGLCAPGPCVAAAQWSLKGSELGAGAHTLTVIAESNTGVVASSEYTLNVYAASPVAVGPGSVNPESGDFALEVPDVSLSGGMGSLALSRHYDSRNLKEGEEGPFGAPWNASLGSLASLEVLPEGSVMVVGPTGLSFFKAKSGGGFEAPQGDANLELKYEPSYEGKHAYLFKDAKEDMTTVFTLPEHASSWMPTVSKGPIATDTTTDEYRTVEVSFGKFIVEPSLELAPHPNLECAKEHWHAGCRALEFVYYESTTAEGEAEGQWKGYKNRLKEVIAVAYNPASKAIVKTPVAAYVYDSQGRLRAEWNPSIKPALKTIYGYDSEDHVTAVTAPGQQPWLEHYGTTAQDSTPGRLLSVGRLGAKTALWNGEVLKNTAAPTLSSTSPLIGTTLSVTNGSWSTSSVLFGYQWEDCNSSGLECAVIPGAVNASYTPQAHDAGYTLVAQVTAENAWGAVTASTVASKVIAMSAPTYSSVFGTTGSESEKLSKPSGVAVDSEGNVWVADLGGNRVEKFSASGGFLASYAPDSMLEPASVAFNATDGDVYVTNRGRDRVDQLSLSGTLIRSFGGEASFSESFGLALGKLNHPNQVAIDSHGDVWVADTSYGRVDEFAATGTYLGSAWGGSINPFGIRSGQLQAPVGVAECGGTLYVADEAADDVQEIAVGGGYIGRYGTKGTGNSEFVSPSQVACEPAGTDVYVVDKGNSRVQEFNGSGSFLEKFGVSGSGEGDFSAPVGIAVGPGGVVYVGDAGNNRISKWKASYSTNNPLPTPPALTENPVSTIEYNVPLSGSGLPNMTSGEISKWGQTKDDPEEGTAVFPPDEPMGWPAANYKRASISYQDEQMRTVNVASPSGTTPTEAIGTSEYNSDNEIVRALSAENRATALKESNPAAASELLDTKSAYNEGELTDTWGPQHTVKLAKGKSETNETVLARNHVKYSYDEGAPEGEPYELVTKVVDGAETASKEEFDQRTAITSYSGQKGLGWKLRTPTSTTTDPTGLDLTKTVEYNETIGNVTETKAPGGSSVAVPPPVFSMSFGKEGSGSGQFKHPVGLALDSGGDVWVDDQENNRIEKFSSSGGLIGTYGSKGSGVDQFESPWGIAVNQSTGNVYVSDSANHRIEELNPSGAFVETIGWGVGDGKEELEVCKTSCKAGIVGSGKGQLNYPEGLTIDSHGDLWVEDYDNNRVEEFSEAGAYLSQFGSTGSGNAQFIHPTGITISEGDIYVVDSGNNRVEELSSNGTYLNQFGGTGSGAGQFKEPMGIVVNPNNANMYVSDEENDRIEEFSPAGKFLVEFGTGGTGVGQFEGPAGLAVNASGDLYIGEDYGDRVDEWVPPGAGGAHMIYSTQFGSAGSGSEQFNAPVMSAIDGQGNVWVTDSNNARVKKFSAQGKFLASYGSYGSGEGQFEAPTGIAINQGAGNVYIADCEDNRIEELSSTGAYVRAFGSYGSEAGKLECPEGVKIDASGDVWVADNHDDRIEEFSSTGGFLEVIGWGVSNGKTELEVCKSSCKTGIAGSGNGQFTEPYDIAISGSNLYVADSGNHRIQELSTSGTYISQFGSQGNGGGQFDYPESLATDASGHLYVVDFGNDRIQEFSASGQFLTSFGSHGSGDGQLNGPRGIAINAAGDTYITDTENNRVEVWAPSNQSVHDTNTIYYSAGTEASVETCRNHPEWVNLPCQIEPAAQPGEDMPNLAVTDIAYNMWEQPEIITEHFGTTERKKQTTFEESGRPLKTEETSSNDQPLPAVTDTYNEHTGLLETQSTKVGETTKTITSTANTLGQPERYTDADGNTAEYKHDIDGRVIEITDGSEEAIKKDGYDGWQKYHFDETTGELTKLEDSAAGTFVAGYTIGGNIAKETYPNGMTAYYTVNPSGQDTAVEYKKETHCTEKCVWFSDHVVPSIHGETITQASTLSEEIYGYGSAGWLNQVQETPTGEGCKTRLYAHEEEGNRTSLTTREPTAEKKCATEGGSVERHIYDSANQLTDTGVTYEAFGNTTALPASDAGGMALTSSFYVDNQVYKQTQNGTTIEYQTDPEDRTRETITSGGAETTKVINHYDGPGNALAWTLEPISGKWTRNIPGIDGTLTATQTNTTTPVLLLHDLQGNVVAEASKSETETKLLKTYNPTEYGVPTSKEAPPKYAWLGADGLTSELPSGAVTQDGTTYVPQTGRPLQTEPIELPQPINSITPYEAELPSWAGAVIASEGALRVTEAEETRHAKELAEHPPGVIPGTEGESEVLETATDQRPDGKGAHSAVGEPVIECNLKAHYPHQSSHNPTTVNFEIWLECTGTVEDIRLRASLYRNHELVGETGYVVKGNGVFAKENIAIPCGDGLYQGWGYADWELPADYAGKKKDKGWSKAITITCV
jgi:YD repeat-containing protein